MCRTFTLFSMMIGGSQTGKGQRSVCPIDVAQDRASGEVDTQADSGQSFLAWPAD